jgi:hypothetical protein
MTGEGFRMVRENEIQFSNAPWKTPFNIAEQIRMQQQEVVEITMAPDWMTTADGHTLRIDGKKPLPWEYFCDHVTLIDDRVFGAFEQRRFEQCEEIPSPENDVVVGSWLIVWSEHHIGALRSRGKQYYPIAVSGTAIEHVLWNLLALSRVMIMPDTQEVHDALQPSSDVMEHLPKGISETGSTALNV